MIERVGIVIDKEVMGVLLSHEKSRDEAKAVVKEIGQVFEYVVKGEEKEAETTRSMITSVVESLASLSSLSENLGLGVLYVDEGNNGKDIKDYLMAELKRDVYGQKL